MTTIIRAPMTSGGPEGLIPSHRVLLFLLALCAFAAAQPALAATQSDSQLYFDPASIADDFYPRIELPDLVSADTVVWASGGDDVLDVDILPALKAGDYPPSYVFSQSDYLEVPNSDYEADLTSGTLTAIFYTPSLYHVRVTRVSGTTIYAVFAESGLKEKDGAPDKTGAVKKLDPLPEGDLIIVENSDTLLDNSAMIWMNGGRFVKRVDNRQDVVDEIEARSIMLGRKIHVELDGHGTTANISTGAGKQNIADKQVDASSVAAFQMAIDEWVDNITIQGCSVGKGAAGGAFLQVLADSIGEASAWDHPVTVINKSHFVVDKDAKFNTKDKSAAAPSLSAAGIVILLCVMASAIFLWQRRDAVTTRG